MIEDINAQSREDIIYDTLKGVLLYHNTLNEYPLHWHNEVELILPLSGSFQVKFETLEQFQTFMIVMKDYKKQNRAYDCSVFCNNMLSTYNIEMFIDFEAANVMPYIGAKDYDPIDITVEQRTNQYVRPN